MLFMEHLLLEQLRHRPMLCDGAMGTLLYARGIPYEYCFDALNLTQPELIQGIHSEYISAGAQIIETNTFGANRAKLEAHQLAERVRDINFRAARLAREAREIAGLPVFIAGAVGPSGRPLQAPDEHRLSELRTIFREQIHALKASFHIGCALNLNMTDEETDRELEKYQSKIEAGAHFIMTQPIYELAPLERFLSRAGHPPIPMLLGCIPLHSSRHAEYLHNEVPGITIPDEVRVRMRAAGERGHEEGLLLAQELLTEARSLVQGVYLMPSYGRYDIVSTLTRLLQTKET